MRRNGATHPPEVDRAVFEYAGWGPRGFALRPGCLIARLVSDSRTICAALLQHRTAKCDRRPSPCRHQIATETVPPSAWAGKLREASISAGYRGQTPVVAVAIIYTLIGVAGVVGGAVSGKWWTLVIGVLLLFAASWWWLVRVSLLPQSPRAVSGVNFAFPRLVFGAGPGGAGRGGGRGLAGRPRGDFRPGPGGRECGALAATRRTAVTCEAPCLE